MNKILIANRGEIALRVMRTAKRMGIETVAVYSEADRESPHVTYADLAICVGPPPSSESYLQMDVIIQAAIDTGADAIHPGYGFLSENSVFAQKVADAGLVFIGPDIHAIEVMGSKLAAKEAVSGYDIPMVPGVDHAVSDIDEATKIAEQVGYPVLIKASAGGGGKGMRVVYEAANLGEQMTRAISEAQSAFGDGAVFVEKYVTSPRHIEIQVLADKHGNVIHLFERECSVQRRHQKVVEEAPSAILTPELRTRMGQAAIDVAKACQYVGAGTVEFLLDAELNFYFLEMNTRLQVEHPVTEMITGIDLVEQQIRVARGEVLAMAQDDLTIDGHAIEVRVYAEDPFADFAPSIGTLTTYDRPEGPGIRVDDGFRAGMDVPIYYDPMVAKLITHGATRQEAIDRAVTAMCDYHIKGLETTIPFGQFVCEHPAFLSGDFDTHFVKKYWTEEGISEWRSKDDKAIASAALAIYLAEVEKLRLPK
jgi:acetyl-CoA carboxylase biotin carboxylase subunit